MTKNKGRPHPMTSALQAQVADLNTLATQQAIEIGSLKLRIVVLERQNAALQVNARASLESPLAPGPPAATPSRAQRRPHLHTPS